MACDLLSEKSTVLVADPQPLIRESLAALVEQGPYRVIGQSMDGDDSMRQIIDKA